MNTTLAVIPGGLTSRGRTFACERFAYGQFAYGHFAYGQFAYGHSAYGQFAYGQFAYGHSAYGQFAYGHSAYGQFAYGHSAYGQFAYGHSAYGQPWAKPGDPLLMEDPKITAIADKYKKTPAQILIRYQKLKDLTCAHEYYAVAVSNRFDVLDALEDPVELWGTFKRETLQAAKECIGERPRSRCGFVSTEKLEKIEESRKLPGLLGTGTSTGLCHAGLEPSWGETRRGAVVDLSSSGRHRKAQIQRDIIVIPKSITQSRIESNIQVFDFSLSAEDMQTIDTFDCNGRVLHLTWVNDHKDYPFHDEY
ncbi:3-oxo-5-beta-steroid 4-dehydrogenase [Chionoecetes opilio]|uniref:3-oxo-5-beta-steroid 4-dehydrogenase n=1 Tax=Chionoecetes opilio TaxID=41210 RepID=A0A8J4YCD6_CHIOP|nr:3-oxo-5-beta-steroid 4-dehydrogenase [Chionoecetes opilio]